MIQEGTTDVILKRTNDFESIRSLAVSAGLDDGPFELIVDAFGLFRGDEMVGCATLKIDGDRHSVEWVAVKDGLRSRGLGSMLVSRVEEEARSKGADRLWALARAPAFFEKIGFRRSREDEPGRPPMLSCGMCKQFRHTCFPDVMVKVF